MVVLSSPPAHVVRAMERPSDKDTSPLRRHAAEALRRARKLPIGHARNDLRQLAMGLLWLQKRQVHTKVQERVAAILTMTELFE
jgi:hypothetical protein